MKQLMIVGDPECVPAAQAIVGEICEVVAYDPNVVVKGRKVVFWPTSPGTGCTEIGKTLALEADEVKLIIVGNINPGWNAAQAYAEGWDLAKFLEWAKPRTVPYIKALATLPENEPPTKSQMAKVEQLGMTATKAGVVCNAANVVKYLESVKNGSISQDEFTNQVYTDGACWNDGKSTELMIYLQQTLGMHRLSSQNVTDAVIHYAQGHKFHQVRDWLSQLEWDGQERIGTFFTTYLGAAETPSHNAFGANFWISLVKRVFEPGCQSDYMVVLEGDQGIGKTRAFQIIGREWYAEVGITADSEDFERQLQGKILIEVAELHSFSKADQSRIKQIITKRVDRYREKYGRFAVDHPRQGILVGTTNETEWIKDQTGGRRFWPVKCGAIDLIGLQRDRDQLFAEAVKKYKAGDPCYIVPKEDVKEMQEQRREAEPWEELLREKVRLIERLTAVEAMALLKIPEERMDARLARRITNALRRLGYENRVVRTGEETKRYWCKRDLTLELLQHPHPPESQLEETALAQESPDNSQF